MVLNHPPTRSFIFRIATSSIYSYCSPSIVLTRDSRILASPCYSPEEHSTRSAYSLVFDEASWLRQIYSRLFIAIPSCPFLWYSLATSNCSIACSSPNLQCSCPSCDFSRKRRSALLRLEAASCSMLPWGRASLRLRRILKRFTSLFLDAAMESGEATYSRCYNYWHQATPPSCEWKTERMLSSKCSGSPHVTPYGTLIFLGCGKMRVKRWLPAAIWARWAAIAAIEGPMTSSRFRKSYTYLSSDMMTGGGFFSDAPMVNI